MKHFMKLFVFTGLLFSYPTLAGTSPPLYQFTVPLSITNGVVSMTPADGTHAGYVTTGVQTLAGAKEFSGAAQFDSTVTSNVSFTGPLFASSNAGAATAGFFRIQNNAAIDWRNNAGNANLALLVNTSDQLTFNGIVLSGSSPLTANRVMITDGSGNYAASSTTTTQVQYLNAATGTTGTTSSNVVFSASPTFSGTVTAAAIVATSLSGSGTVPSEGLVRVANNTKGVCWENAAGNNDYCIYLDGSNNYQFQNPVYANGFNDSGLTVSQAVFSDGSKNLVSNPITGTGNVVMSASPTMTGTTTVGNILDNGLTASQAVFSDGSKNLVSNAITGTGNVAMSANPAFTAGMTWGTAVAANRFIVSQVANTGTIEMSGYGAGPLVDGGGLIMYGALHSTKPDWLEFYSNGLPQSSLHADGTWCFGTGCTVVSDTQVSVGHGSTFPVGTNSSTGFRVNGTFPSSATSGTTSLSIEPATAAAAWTTPYSLGVFVQPVTKGAGSTITRNIAFYHVDDSAGTNNAWLADNISFTGNWFINYAGSLASTIGGPVSITNATSSTSTSTGALIVSGGEGLAGSLFVGGNITDAGLSASQAVVTNGSKQLVSLAYTNANTATTLVERDGSGNFSAGTITAALTGTASGNTTYTANNHGVVISGSANAMTVIAPDASATKVLKSGGAAADPSWLAYDNANTVSTLVFRDSSGNFAGNLITGAAFISSGGTVPSEGILRAENANKIICAENAAGNNDFCLSFDSSSHFQLQAPLYSNGFNDSALTVSLPVFSDGSKNLVSNAMTGTGNVVMSASPTLTGTPVINGAGFLVGTNVAGNQFVISQNFVNSGSIAIGGNGNGPTNDGGGIIGYGSTHATKADFVELWTDGAYQYQIQPNGTQCLGANCANVSDSILSVGLSSTSYAPSSSGSSTIMRLNGKLDSSTTSGSTYLSIEPQTRAAAFTEPYILGVFVQPATKGAGSTITRNVAWYHTDDTAGTNNAHFADNISFTGNWFINYGGSNPSTIGGSLTLGGAALAPSFRSTSGTIAPEGVLRMANNDRVCWENAAANNDYCMIFDSSNHFVLQTTLDLSNSQVINLGSSSGMWVSNASTESTGAGTASLGTNSPAGTLSAPYKWLKVQTSDGSTVFIPAWK